MTEVAPGGWLWLAATAALAAISAVAQIVAAMLERAGPIRLRHWAEEAGGRLLDTYENPGRFEVFRYLLSLISRLTPVLLLAVAFIPTQALPGVGAGRGLLLACAGVALVLIFSELLIRYLVGRDPETVLRALTRIYRPILLALTPVVLILARISPFKGLRRRGSLENEDEASDEEIDAFLEVGAREGILEPGEEDMILRVIDFGDALVRSVMTPRTDMICADVTADLETLAEAFLDSRHSRLPLYASSVDEIVGVLHIRDLFRALRAASAPAASSLALPPFFVPETKPLDELLRNLQAQRQEMAIVVDEFGGTAGLVTIEDLVEEIVGEIVDEHDDEEAQQRQLPDGSWRVDGMLRLDELDALFGAELDQEPYETVGGLIFGLLGRVPEPGSSLESHGLRFTVETVADRRVQAVRVRALGEAGA